jgi:hypothetical protein
MGRYVTIFVQNELEVYASTNKQLISSQVSLTFCLGFAGKG